MTHNAQPTAPAHSEAPRAVKVAQIRKEGAGRSVGGEWEGTRRNHTMDSDQHLTAC